MLFRTFQNPLVSCEIGDSSPSETVPNDALTIHEVLDRFVNGETFPTSNPVYDNADIDDDFAPEDIEDFDLVDAQQMSEYYDAKLKQASEDDTSKQSATADTSDKSDES